MVRTSLTANRKARKWSLKRTLAASRRGSKYIVGIDEVGRGPLAGPIAVCAFKVEIKTLIKLAKAKNFLLAGLDSKKLTPENREFWSERVKTLAKTEDLDWHVSYGENESIDALGLTKVIKKAIKSCLYGIAAKAKDCHILLDGSLKAEPEFTQETIIKGDEKELVIALASIIAKVSRDRLMVKLSEKYPKYFFHEHKGYGTKKHIAAIKKYGLSPIHRRSFLGKLMPVCRVTPSEE